MLWSWIKAGIQIFILLLIIIILDNRLICHVAEDCKTQTGILTVGDSQHTFLVKNIQLVRLHLSWLTVSIKFVPNSQ